MTDLPQDTRLSAGEKSKVLLIYSVIGAATISGFAASMLIGRVSIAMAGLGVVAFVFGLRHGVDADHIAAIDNVTRKLIQEGKRPLTVGTWFSLGHSTVVLLLILILIFATRSAVQALPGLQDTGALIGALASSGFLLVLGLMNLTIVLGLYRVFRGLREGRVAHPESQDMLDGGGMLNRCFRSLFKTVSEPWKTYPIGLLFGLGFDTASEIALIAISLGVGVSASVPIWWVLLLPAMFTCGMVLVDTTDGVAMRMVYGWAALNPLRKIYYNLTITILSVLVALGIGGIELLQLMSGELNLQGPFWSTLSSLDFVSLGAFMVVLFGFTWIFSMGYWKYRRYDENALGNPRMVA